MICSALKPGEAVRRQDASPSGLRADGEDQLLSQDGENPLNTTALSICTHCLSLR